MPDGVLPPGQGRRLALPPGLSPRYLSADEAAAYVGVSKDVFLAEVEQGLWPPARRRGGGTPAKPCEPPKPGKRLTWDRVALDRYADIDSHLVTASPELAAERASAAEQAVLRGIQNGPAPLHRNQGRPPAAR